MDILTVQVANAVAGGENRRAQVTECAVGGDGVTMTGTNAEVVMVIEKVKAPVTTRTQTSEKCRDAEVEVEVFVCWERVVKWMSNDESARVWKVGAAKTVKLWEMHE